MTIATDLIGLSFEFLEEERLLDCLITGPFYTVQWVREYILHIYYSFEWAQEISAYFVLSWYSIREGGWQHPLAVCWKWFK